MCLCEHECVYVSVNVCGSICTSMCMSVCAPCTVNFSAGQRNEAMLLPRKLIPLGQLYQDSSVSLITQTVMFSYICCSSILYSHIKSCMCILK